jgi:1-deoxy-D-xylulose-5-phosphate reductoisomerase
VRRVAILGSTGSIGRSALSVVDAHQERLEVVALVAGENADELARQAARYRPKLAGLASRKALEAFEAQLGSDTRPAHVLAGPESLIEAATHPDVDVVLCASSGTAGLEAALAAIDAGKTLALANKEVLVMAGDLMVRAARARGVTILPVDSEHNAIHQCLHGRDPSELRRLIVTASGGPFRTFDVGQLATVTPEDALRHPTWRMGRKITVDSATLMNKGLEVIEARWLFGVGADEIDVVIHPQSIVHSMVELCDGSVIAQLSVTDMRLPIQYAFSYPERWTGTLPALDVAGLGTLDFQPPDAGPVALNAANEVAVEAFLNDRLSFVGIPQVIEHTLEAADRETGDPRSLADVRAADAWARAFSSETISTLPSSKTGTGPR